ncbi:glycosyltransferase family 39 protein [Romeria aff. gracilis LEGE 07310]|uniref:Glycosyltransferase family 39 protein n=1 Tax=Vasconcelosia minhoensis LEGE 07310 TaxID=915328 RepID=A0A8J7ANY4_9CYAN|nr:glycosyltransferase family 39 protein [Romeria gracilis]MBE9077611.1 glycosyltransferase family 39 protein [Romeria aff. gracilis LEGE 07310]
MAQISFKPSHQTIRWIGPWLLGGLLYRSVIAWAMPPGFDEAYYYLYTRHLDWSYFDHPLMVALTSGFGLWLTGMVSPLTLRLGALGLFTGSLYLLYRTGQRLLGESAGRWSLAIASLIPIFFLALGTFAAPDNGLIFFWTAVLWVSACEFFPSGPYRPTARIVLIGLLLGLACLSKYHGFVFGLSLVGFCATSPEHRRALRSPWTALSLLLFGLVLLPLLYWNATHGWISFRFHLSSRFDSSLTSTYSLSNLLGVLAAELGYLFPTLGLPLWWVSVRETLAQLRRMVAVKPHKPDPLLAQKRFLLWCGLPTAVGFTLLGGLTPIYPAWPTPGLWSLTPLLGQTVGEWQARSRPAVRRWLGGSGLAIGSLLLFALLHITLGTLQKPSQYALFGGLIAPQADPSTTLIDVMQLRQRLIEDSEVRSAIAAADFLVTPEFWLSGYVAIAVEPLTEAPVMAFSQDPRGHALWFQPADWLGQDAIFISIADFSQAETIETYQPYFETFKEIAQVKTRRGGAVSEVFYLYRAANLVKAYEYPY